MCVSVLDPFCCLPSCISCGFAPISQNPRWPPADVLENFEWWYLLNGSSNLLHVWFYGVVFGIGGSIGTIWVSIKSKMTPMEDTCTTRFSITWKNSSPTNTGQCSGRFTGSYHEYTLSEPSAVVHSSDWLHLDTFRVSTHGTWCHGESWIHTFWAHCSG